MSTASLTAPADRRGMTSPEGTAPGPLRFELPADHAATAPPESRGLARDEVRLLVASHNGIAHRHARDLPELLAPGDLVVINTSATVPSAIDVVHLRGGRSGSGSRNPATSERPTLHVAGPHPDEDGTIVGELRHRDGRGPVWDASVGDRLLLPGALRAELVAGYPDSTRRAGNRLWQLTVDQDPDRPGLLEILASHGRPIVYAYLQERPGLDAYRSAFAIHPGSAEMPSAGRPLTSRVITGLVARGIVVAPVVLHTGVSSLERHEDPPQERYEVPGTTARLVTATRRHGGRVIAVGTTVTRALETVAAPDGTVRAGRGWTDLVLGPHRAAYVVNGLVTGWHEPDASHLRLLQAVAGDDLLQQAYAAALANDYRWHEFGDVCLLLP